MKTALLRPLAACLVLLAGQALAADWPQWRGPDRTDVSKEKGLLKAWPKGGPKLLWAHKDAGVGYSGFSVVGDKLYSMGSWKGKEHLFALDAKSGKRLWASEVGAFYDNDWGGGPRATPTVDGDRVYALGAQGNLLCVKASDGAKVWRVSLPDDLGGEQPDFNWGYTESPLIDGDKVVCTPGGAKGTLAALDKKSGKALWRSKAWTDEAVYPSVVKATLGGVAQYVQMTDENVAGVAAKDGSLLWKFERSARIVVPTPIVFGDFVYVASGYGAGSNLLKVTATGGKFKVEEVYASRVMQNHHGGVILLDGHAYGYCDRNGWVCQDVKKGTAVWKSKRLGKGSIAYADGRFYCYAEDDGTAVLIEASAKGWSEKGRFSLPQTSKLPRPARNSTNLWTHPVVANGRLYLRDQELIFCYDVKGG